MEIRRIGPEDRGRVNDLIMKNWYSLEMAVHGELFDLGRADGFTAEEDGEIAGLLTFRADDKEMEILSLDSFRENRGVGTALLKAAIAQARSRSLRRIMLVATNDNTRAIRFYQKRGFDMAALYRGAVEKARRLKPSIPLMGNDDIPLRHEIEFELLLRDPAEGRDGP